jgi:uncharacterized protein YbgA (DUF1722 family)/uncharacterized protein YbbK (DUF523 family)
MAQWLASTPDRETSVSGGGVRAAPALLVVQAQRNQTLQHASSNDIRIGISSCLLGQQVRFDGGHKRDHFVNDVFGPFVEFVPVCPEVESGMPIPRESIRLVQADGIRLLGTKSGNDHTSAMQRFCARKVRELEKLDLSGYVLKKGSPSCGLERIRIYQETGGVPSRSGRGMFAEALIEALPDLPVEDEGRLHDARLRENFVECVFAYNRVLELFRKRWKVGDLVNFHTAHKLLLMAHDPVTYRKLGRLVASAKASSRPQLARDYRSLYMFCMRRQATTRRNVNVLQHIQGYFKRNATPEDRLELDTVIKDYRKGLVPLIVPITLIRHLVRLYDVEYLQGQIYLEPHPKELMLRHHV